MLEFPNYNWSLIDKDLKLKVWLSSLILGFWNLKANYHYWYSPLLGARWEYCWRDTSFNFGFFGSLVIHCCILWFWLTINHIELINIVILVNHWPIFQYSPTVKVKRLNFVFINVLGLFNARQHHFINVLKFLFLGCASMMPNIFIGNQRLKNLYVFISHV